MADLVGPCDECGRIYNRTVLKSCPGCAASASTHSAGGTSSQSPAQQASDRNAEIVNLLKESIRASNRTTYAVRSMVSYTVITVITLLIAGIFVGIAALAGGNAISAVFAIIGGLVLLGGIILAFVTLIREWALSDVPNR